MMDFRNEADYVFRLYHGTAQLTDGHLVHIRPSWMKENAWFVYTEGEITTGRIDLDKPVMGIPPIVSVRVSWLDRPVAISSKDLMF